MNAQKNILLPQVELTMASVQVVEWLVKVGDTVKADQPILEVESQKGIVEVPSPEAGIVRQLCVNPGDTIGAKALICVLTDTADEAIADVVPASTDEGASTGRRPPAAVSVEPEGVGVKAAPAARKLAKDLGVDLVGVKGSGPGGRITVDDVQAAAADRGRSPPGEDAASLPDTWLQLPPSRLALNQQMQKSLVEIPQFHVARRMNVAPLAVKAEGITFTHRLVHAVAHALAKHPALRTTIAGDKVCLLPAHVAVAMDTPHGLVAPAVRQADRLSLEQIAARIKELRARADAGRSRREDLGDAPFAVSNLGMHGIDCFTPFVFYGQTAVLAIGRARDDHAWFTLAVDHRVVNGAEAGRFLETLHHAIAGTSK